MHNAPLLILGNERMASVIRKMKSPIAIYRMISVTDVLCVENNLYSNQQLINPEDIDSVNYIKKYGKYDGFSITKRHHSSIKMAVKLPIS
jgi:hypothetical protein